MPIACGSPGYYKPQEVTSVDIIVYLVAFSGSKGHLTYN